MKLNEYSNKTTTPTGKNFIYVLSQNDNEYGAYTSCVVAARSEEAARNYSPSDYGFDEDEWADEPSNVDVNCVGIADEKYNVYVFPLELCSNWVD